MAESRAAELAKQGSANEKAAGSTPGVQQVVNELEVKGAKRVTKKATAAQ